MKNCKKLDQFHFKFNISESCELQAIIIFCQNNPAQLMLYDHLASWILLTDISVKIFGYEVWIQIIILLKYSGITKCNKRIWIRHCENNYIQLCQGTAMKDCTISFYSCSMLLQQLLIFVLAIEPPENIIVIQEP